MNSTARENASTDLDHCVHEARNALAAMATASELLARLAPSHPLANEASLVVQRQGRQLSERLSDLVVHVRSSHGRFRVLAISDDAHLLAALGRMLTAHDCRTDFAASSEDGLHALTTRRHQLALVDVRTSNGAGLAVARRARDAGFEGRLFAIWSARLPHQRAQEEGIAGFDLLLSRSVETGAFKAALDGVIPPAPPHPHPEEVRPTR